jgi:membrane protein YdbS with pleckstrin-like domain
MSADTPQQTVEQASTTGVERAGQSTNGTASDAEVLFATNPSAKPTAVTLGLVVLTGLVIVGYLLSTPEALGDPETTRIGVYVVAFVFVLAVARLLVRVYLLTRFRYAVTEHALRWEYSLLYYSKSRELPLSKLRGHERTQSRIQTALGVGTVEFLTAVNTHGIGYLAFENVAEPERVQTLIRDHVARGDCDR